MCLCIRILCVCVRMVCMFVRMMCVKMVHICVKMVCMCVRINGINFLVCLNLCVSKSNCFHHLLLLV